jgi:hypothetical protein
MEMTVVATDKKISGKGIGKGLGETVTPFDMR